MPARVLVLALDHGVIRRQAVRLRVRVRVAVMLLVLLRLLVVGPERGRDTAEQMTTTVKKILTRQRK